VFTRLGSLSKAVLYYIIAFALCIAVTLQAPFLGERTLHVVMFTPLVSVSLMLLVLTHDGYKKAGWIALGLHRPGVSGWGLALLLPPLVLGFAYGSVWLSGVAAFVVPESIGSMPSYLFDLIAAIIIVAVFGALGEEIGWRGLSAAASPRLGAAAGHAHQWPASWALAFARDDLDAFLSRCRQSIDHHSIVSPHLDYGGSLLWLPAAHYRERLAGGSRP
jgi:membrane protease YdiL (CAAX protease family)